MLEPVEIIHVPDHSYLKGPRGARGCKSPDSNGKSCNKAHFHPTHNLPTLNEALTHDWVVYQGALKHWKPWLIGAVTESGLPRGLAAITVDMLLVFPTRNRRDEGNMRGFIEKALGDSLASPLCMDCAGTEARKGRCLACGSSDLAPPWIPDDTFFPVVHYSWGVTEARYESGVREMRLLLSPLVELSDDVGADPFPDLG